MEISKDKNVILSNHEVFAFMKELTNAPKKKKKQSSVNLANVAYEVVRYLEKTPCKYQSPEVIQKFLTVLPQKGFKLTKAEKLQLLNLRPTTAVEMELIIEDSEERLSEEQIEELISVVQEYLPSETD